MRGIKILCVGKVKEKYFQEGIAFYVRQIRKKYPMEIVECEDEPTPEGASLAEEQKIKEKEGLRLLRKIKEEDYVVALCIDGWDFFTKKKREKVLFCAILRKV